MDLFENIVCCMWTINFFGSTTAWHIYWHLKEPWDASYWMGKERKDYGTSIIYSFIRGVHILEQNGLEKIYLGPLTRHSQCELLKNEINAEV